MVLYEDWRRVCSRVTGVLSAGRPDRVTLIVVAGALVSFPTPLFAADGTLSAVIADTSSERFAVHGQITYVEQETNTFTAPYAGPNSLSPHQGRETSDATLYLGARLWSGGEVWLTPEIDQGFGLNDTLGVAGFPSGEAYKVGRKKPYVRLPRAFVRQTVNLDAKTEPVDTQLLQFAGARSPERWVITAGKFGVADIFDTNQYAHDPRADFLNWAVVDAGSFDYAADAWGYSVGISVERYRGDWTLRSGIFDLSNVPNGEHLTPGGHQFQMIAEVERRHEMLGQPGKALITVFESRGRFGLLDDAVRLAKSTGRPVDIAAVRRYRSRVGVHLGFEQQVASDLGLFARAGKAGGDVETDEFSDIDRTVSIGLSLKGTRWARAPDTVGVAGTVNGISAARQHFLSAGGLGLLVGDGRLPDPGVERILEMYYSLAVRSQCFLTIDYQHVVNPGYNRDRGPVSVFAARIHAQF